MTNLKDIALELLQKYEESETSLIWEYSGDIDKSEKILDAEVSRYRELIDKYAEQEQEQKTGHWVEKKGRCGTYIECSECGGLAPSTEFADVVWFKKSNFCHECGAKMIESEG